MAKPDYAALLAKAFTAADNATQDFPETPDCGFAWVTIHGRSGLASYARRQGIGHKGYPNGWDFWCPGTPSQSLSVRIAGAKAFAKVLFASGEVLPRVDWRLD